MEEPNKPISNWKITIKCFYCENTEVLEVKRPKFIEDALPGWVAVNFFGDKDENKINYVCPDCVHKIKNFT